MQLERLSLKTYITGERLNFIVASCAILISGASFYATYLQANSAEQQVKAMTWPLIEFSHGNYDTEAKEKNLTLSLKNAGVGPAIIKTVNFVYKDKPFRNLNDFIRSCCESSLDNYIEKVKENQFDADIWTLTTAPVNDIILPVGGQLDFLSLVHHPSNRELWQAINKERWDLQLEVCYCSLLENCYVTNEPGSVRDVQACGKP